MKNIIRLVVLSLFFVMQSCSLFSETLLYPIKIGEKYGYINYDGDLIIKPLYTRAYEFSEGLASVRINDECAYINKQGKIILQIDADFAGTYSEGLAFFLKNQQLGYIDLKGNIVIPARFQDADPFMNGFACVSLDGKDFYINHDGENVFGKTFDECYSFNEGYAVVRVLRKNADGSISKTRKVIDANGQIVLDPDNFQIQGNKVSCGIIQGKQGNYYGYFNLKGEMVINVGENYANDFYEGYASIYDTSVDKDGMIDIHGDWIIEPTYDALGYMSEGLIPFGKDDRYGFININETVVIPNVFRDVLLFSNGMARVNPRDGYDGGYVNKEGKIFLGKDYIDLPNTN